MTAQNSKSLTVPEKILIAAIKINGDEKTFTAEDLVVAAWKLFPDVFGLQGYADKYPDSNKILSNIMGSKGLREKKWIRKVGEKKYRITEAGKEAGAQLSNQQNQVSHSSALSREGKEILYKVINSKAYEKFQHGKIDEVHFGDACSFWNISVRSNAAMLNNRLNDLETIISTTEKLIIESENKAISLTHGGEAVTLNDILGLRNLNELLLAKFDDQIAIIRSRQDERRY
jgi:hypothetical protein